MKNSNIYSRWLRKELSEEEKAKLKSSGDHDILEKIISETDSWTLPDLRQGALGRLNEKINSGEIPQIAEGKVISLQERSNFWIYGVAASLLLIAFSTYFLVFFNKTITHQSLAGQQLKITLPDQSIVILNGQSSIAYKEKSFLENREINFEGEGYFEVLKKGDFKVAFPSGEVKVLGTRFTILSGKNIASIKCFEGKVLVTDHSKINQILTPNQGIRLINGMPTLFEVSAKIPEWTEGESIFKDTPLQEVITALSIQYDVEFETGKIKLNRNYSGKFVHQDLKTSLNMVFTPMGIKFSIEENKNRKSKITLSE